MLSRRSITIRFVISIAIPIALIIGQLTFTIPTVRAASLNVTTTADSADCASAPAGSLRSILCGTLSPGDIINITVPGTITLQAMLPQITVGGVGVTISGYPTTIQGAAGIRAFSVTSTGVLGLTNLTLTGSNCGVATPCNGSTYGGAIYNAGKVTITNSTLSNNSAEYGGAIYNNTYNNVLQIGNSTLSGNSATYGGAVHTTGQFYLVNSTLANNTATSKGGAVLNMHWTKVSGTTFSGNSTGGTGGAIASGADGYTAELVINSSTFNGNSSSGGGGALYFITNALIYNSTFNGNTSSGAGGALYLETNTLAGGSNFIGLLISNSTISGNSASSGGGISNSNPYYTPTLASNIVAGNTTTGSGPDVVGTVRSDGYNLFGNTTGFTTTVLRNAGTDKQNVSPLLSALADNGGPSKTMALQAGSPAIGAGRCNTPSSEFAYWPSYKDQRSALRKAVCDIGAYETSATPILTIKDVKKKEPSSGTTTFTFTAGLNIPASTVVNFTVATSDGTATVVSGDYVASQGNFSIPSGSKTFSFDITVNSDSVSESDETFFVNILSVTGAANYDPQAQGTITTTDPNPISWINQEFTTACDISGYVGTLDGFVTFDGTTYQLKAENLTTGQTHNETGSNSGPTWHFLVALNINGVAPLTSTNDIVRVSHILSSGDSAIYYPCAQLPTAENSLLSVSNVSVTADGTSTSQVTATVRDYASRPIAGVGVTLSYTTASGNNLGVSLNSAATNSATATTDSTGKAIFTLKSTQAQTLTLSVSTLKSNVTVPLTQHPVITFRSDNTPITLNVTTTEDSSDCATAPAGSLRAALCSSLKPGDVINITVPGTITLQAMLPQITVGGAGVTINGYPTTIKGGAGIRILSVNNSATLTLTKVTLSGASCTLATPCTAPDVYNGAAVYNSGTLMLTASTISNNTAIYGAGIYSNGTLKINDSKFLGNSGDYGGGIRSTGGVQVTNTTFSDNTAQQSGAGIGVGSSSTDTTIIDSTFSGNSAVGTGGGALYVYPSTTVTVAGSTFTDNYGDSGGAITNYGTLNVSNSTFDGNNSLNSGAAISNANTANLVLVSSVISRNTGASGGLYNAYPLQAKIGNSIFAGNTATVPGYGADIDGSITSLGNNIIGNTQYATGFIGSDQQNVDPLLGTLADNGGPTQTIALLAGSPAIRAGNCNLASPIGAITKDQRGIDRLTPCDVGAYETRSVGIKINNVSHNEGDSGTTIYSFTVSLYDPAPVGGITFDIATADGSATAASGDYTAKSLTSQLIPEGSTDYTFDVLVNGDTLAENHETFFVNLSNVTGVTLITGQGKGTITNDDGLPDLTISDVSHSEGNSGTTTYTFTVSLSAAATNDVTFDIATADDTATTASGDYTAKSLTSQTIVAGNTSYTFDVVVNDDTNVEGNETFFVNVTNVVGAILSDGQGTGTITNDDYPSLSINDVSKSEGNSSTTTYTFTVSLNSTSDNDVTFDIATANGTATTASGDYTAKSLTSQTIAAGNTSYTFDVVVNGDTSVEGNETFFVNVSNVTGATVADAQGQGTITDDDTVTLNINDISHTEGNSGTTAYIFTVTLDQPAGPNGVTFNIATADNTATSASGDYTAGSLPSQTITAGNSSYTFTVLVNGDMTVEGDETFFVNISNVTNGVLSDAQGQGTIVNDDVDVPVLQSPTDGTVTTNNTPIFIWSSVASATTYQIQIDTTNSFSNSVQAVFTTNPTYTATKLTDGTTYYWRVRALRNNNTETSTWSAARVLTIDKPRLPAPTLSAPASGTLLAVLTPQFTWTAVTGAAKYSLQVDDDPNFGSPLFTKSLGTVTSYTAIATDGLQFGSTYYWRVSAGTVSNAFSDWSATRSFTLTLMKTPANAAYSTSATPTFTWESFSGATKYELQVSKTLDFALLEHSYSGTALQTVVPAGTPLSLGVHHWRLRVTTASGTSAWMQSWMFTVTTTLPAAPVLTAPATGLLMAINTPTFTWNATSTTLGQPFDYQIQITSGTSFTNPVQDERRPTSVLTYTAALLPDGVYSWRVRAINNLNVTGAWSAVRTFTVDTTAPNAPVLSVPKDWSATTSTRPAFSWLAATGAKTYSIEVYSAGANCTSLVLKASASNLTTLTFTPTITLSAGSYCWRVQAKDAAGNTGTFSPYFHVQINATAIPAPGLPVTAAPANATNWTDINLPAFTWTMATVGNRFQIQIATTSTFANPLQDVVTAPDQLTYTANPSLGAGTYYWHIRAINSQNVAGAWTATQSFTVNTFVPAIPVLLSPADGGTAVSNPVLSWQSITGVKSYNVQVATDLNFTNKLVNKTGLTTASYTVPVAETLPYGSTYYWRVQAVNVSGTAGSWSQPFTLYTNILKTPLDGSATTLVRPTFAWNAVSGATSYTLQVASDSTFGFNTIRATATGAMLQYAIPSSTIPLTQGVYYWRVLVKVGTSTITLPAWKITIVTTVPTAPVLTGPSNNGLINDNTPTFTWQAATNGQTYQVQIDDLSTFASPQESVTTGIGLLTYTANPLADGKYFWRVRALNLDGAPGTWSAVWAVTIDATAPSVPTLAGPADNTTTTNPQLTLRWNAATSAASYEIRIGTTNPPTTPSIVLGNVLTYMPPVPLSYQSYYWQVRAKDAAGNYSAWSTVRQFTVAAGLTSARVPPTPTEIATGIASETSTATVIPMQTVEAESAFVLRSGSWTVQATDNASGGSYLYSGAAGDALQLTFSGSRLVIIFVQHPALGSFTIELDGTVMQTVSETGDQTFGQSVSLDNLSSGTHTLRIYAAQGTMTVDAFAVEPQALTVPVTATPTATATPTQAPTDLPTATVEATVLPTETPLPETQLPETQPAATLTESPLETATEVPTATPTLTPLVAPLIETMDNGVAQWSASGSWVLEPSDKGGANWLATASTQTSVLMLAPVQTVNLNQPSLTFVSRQVISGTSGASAQVEISLDGHNWQIIAAVAPSADGATITVDLSAYRAQTVWLRFVWSSTDAGTWQLDDVSINEISPTSTAMPPTFTATATSTELPPTVVETAAPIMQSTETATP